MSHSTPASDNRRLTLSYIPIDSITDNPRDARIYKPAEKQRIAKALKTFGPIPLMVDPDNRPLSGNIWLHAARAAGLSEVPVIVMRHLSMAEADAFMLAQIRLVENGKWDESKLGAVLRDLTIQGIDFDISITGFDPPEIDLRIEALGNTEREDEEKPISEGPAITQLGYLWLLDRHQLLCGDSLIPENYAVIMGGAKADVVTSDPPFNTRIKNNVSGLGKVKHTEFAMASGEMSEVEFIAFLVRVFELLIAYSRIGSLHYIAMDWRHIYEIVTAGRQAYAKLLNMAVWVKNNGGMGAFYRSRHELFFIFRNGDDSHINNIQLGRYGRNRTNVWEYPGANSFGRGGEEGDLLSIHPTVKPVALIADALLDASRRGDLVLDPFMGSGSTLIAAEKVGRVARGIEIHPPFVDAAVRRWQRWTGGEARLVGTGQTFNELEKLCMEKNRE